MIFIYFQEVRYKRQPTMAEVFMATHAIEQTDEEGNVSYNWLDDKSRSAMVKLFILNVNILAYFISPKF